MVYAGRLSLEIIKRCGQVHLWVKVYGEYTQPFFHQREGQVLTGRSFTHAALLIGDDDCSAQKTVRKFFSGLPQHCFHQAVVCNLVAKRIINDKKQVKR